jgi:hypothetical protein
MTFQWQDKEKQWDAPTFDQEGKEQDGGSGLLDPDRPHVSLSKGH